MRTAVALAGVLVASLFVGSIAAASLPGPAGRELVHPPADIAQCSTAYRLRASGLFAWLDLEGGMWDFHVYGEMYDLYGVEGRLSAGKIAYLRGHPGRYVPATVEGIVEPCLFTTHQHGAPTLVTSIEVFLYWRPRWSGGPRLHYG